MPSSDTPQKFLETTAFAGSAIRDLAGDASNRRYYRVTSPTGSSAVLMVVPPETGTTLADFRSMTGRLRAAGYSAPEILAVDPQRGFMLIEDMGDDLFARIVGRGTSEETLYTAAIEVLADLSERQKMADDLPPYDLAFYAFEVDILLDWYLPAMTGAATPPTLRDDLHRALAHCVAGLSSGPEVCVLRDYHAENLIWLPERSGLARVGLLDYQDARAGHAAYDLASLLLDVRRDVGAATVKDGMALFAELKGYALEQVEADVVALGLQRNLKILGIFTRLAVRDGKPAYLDLLPRVWNLIALALDHPSAGALGPLIRREIPVPDPARIRAATA